MKNPILERVPAGLIDVLRRSKRIVKARIAPEKDTQQIFSEIYRKGHWKKAAQEQETAATEDSSKFSSGIGSSQRAIVEPYIQTIQQQLNSFKHTAHAPVTLVDLGCGDFQVSRAFVESVDSYIGTDIVPDVVAYNQSQYGSAQVEFRHLNIVEDALPQGDVALIRQVLQHLSNAKILKILPKFAQYKAVFVTEHYPSPNPAIVPNKDWITGRGIRILENSGVFLDHAPFNQFGYQLEEILEVPGHNIGYGIDPGVIKTYKLLPS
ncbi:MAG: methyltransferase domain-containing protein [Cyanobacteria bacterium J06634_5]